MPDPQRLEAGRKGRGVQKGFELVESLLKAIKKTFRIVLGGLLAGVMMLMAANAAKAHWGITSYWSELGYDFFVHLSAGLFVSAIAVVFYEWGSHLHENVLLSERLQSTSENLVATNREFIALVRRRVSPGALTRALKCMTLSNHESEPKAADMFRTQIEQLVSHVAKMLQDPAEGKVQWVHFLSDQLKPIVTDAQLLASLGPVQEAPLHGPPSLDDVADQILARHMEVMETGECYLVISSLPTWTHSGLEQFKKATRDALDRGVRIQRVINLLRYPEEQRDLEPARVRRVLLEHLGEAKARADNYEVRMFGPDQKAQMADSYRSQAAEQHFGLFVQAQSATKYDVRHPNLSEMTLGQQDDRIAAARKVFRAFWEISIPLTSETVEDVLRKQLWLANRES